MKIATELEIKPADEFNLAALRSTIEQWKEYEGSPAHFRAIVEQIAELDGSVILALKLTMIVGAAVGCVRAARARELPAGN